MSSYLKKEDTLALKGIAIIIMLFHHCFRLAVFSINYDVSFYPFGRDNIINVGVYAKICVPIFAFLSGYGLYVSYKKLKAMEEISGWVKKRLISTLSGFWFVAIFSYMVIPFVECFLNGKNSLIDLYNEYGSNHFGRVTNILSDILGLSNLFGTKSLNGTWWYIGTAACLIVFMPLMVCIFKKCGGFATLIMISVLPYMFEVNIGGKGIYTYILVFYVGILFCEYDIFGKAHEFLKKYKLIKLIVMILLMGMTIYLYNAFDKKTYWWLHFGLIPVLVLIFCTEYIIHIKYIKEILCFLGKHSLNIWLVHTFYRTYIPGVIWSGRWFLICPLIMLVISLITSIIIEFVKKISKYNVLIDKLSKKI